jgi:hypothetical protein
MIVARAAFGSCPSDLEQEEFEKLVHCRCNWLGTALYSRALGLMPFFLLLVTIGESANAQERSSTTLLQAGISHSEMLPALPPNQQVGQVFDGFNEQPNLNEEAQEAIRQTKQSVQQPLKTTPVQNLPGTRQSNPKSAAAPPQKSTAKAMLSKMRPGSAKPPAQPSQADIAAAIQYYANQRYQHGAPQQHVSRPQSSTLQSQTQTGTRTSANGQSTSMLNGYGWSRQACSSSQRNSSSVKSPAERRFRIPAWMAGVWQRSDSNELSRVSLPSGKRLKAVGYSVAGAKDSFGTYRDESGQIWQVFDPRNATGSMDRGTAIDYHTVTAYDIIISGNDAPVVAVRATHVIVSKSTHRVVSSFQDEELNTYSKTPDGKLRTDSSVKVFDAKGKPQLLTTALSMEALIAPFSGPVRKATK